MRKRIKQVIAKSCYQEEQDMVLNFRHYYYNSFHIPTDYVKLRFCYGGDTPPIGPAMRRVRQKRVEKGEDPDGKRIDLLC